MYFSRSKSNSGFTLIEILIVIVILGVLLTIAITTYKSIVERTKKEVCIANQRTIEAGRMYYFASTGSYGSNLADIEAVFSIMNIENNEQALLCPAGGTYTFNTDTDEVTCNIGGHNP